MSAVCCRATPTSEALVWCSAPVVMCMRTLLSRYRGTVTGLLRRLSWASVACSRLVVEANVEALRDPLPFAIHLSLPHTLHLLAVSMTVASSWWREQRGQACVFQWPSGIPSSALDAAPSAIRVSAGLISSLPHESLHDVNVLTTSGVLCRTRLTV